MISGKRIVLEISVTPFFNGRMDSGLQAICLGGQVLMGLREGIDEGLVRYLEKGFLF